MKTFLQALGMAVVLFFYGYFLSTAGHDHSAHQHSETHSEVKQEHAHHSGEHDHSHH